MRTHTKLLVPYRVTNNEATTDVGDLGNFAGNWSKYGVLQLKVVVKKIDMSFMRYTTEAHATVYQREQQRKTILR